MNREDAWTAWLVESAKQWRDIASVVKETQIEIVDADHKRMTEYALELNHLISRIKNKDLDFYLITQLSDLLTKLYTYSAEHFSREEYLIAFLKLPGLKEMEKHHTRLLKMLDSIIKEYQAGRLAVSADLKTEILNWVIKHINGVDFETFKFANLSNVFKEAQRWEDVKDVIRKTGIDEMDRDHKNITLAILDLAKTIEGISRSADLEESEKKERLMYPLDYLLNITSDHFNREGSLIRRYDIGTINEQEEKHLEFLSYLERVKKDISNLNFFELPKLKSYTIEWLVKHINVLDYDTFKRGDWALKIFEKAENERDLAWIIMKTGIPEIDEDHLHFVSLVFKLKELFQTRDLPEKEAALRTLDLVRTYRDFASSHFAREEKRMEQDGSKMLESHRSEHNHLLETFDFYIQSLESGMISITENLKTTFLHWWINHTNNTDIITFGAAQT